MEEFVQTCLFTNCKSQLSISAVLILQTLKCSPIVCITDFKIVSTILRDFSRVRDYIENTYGVVALVQLCVFFKKVIVLTQCMYVKKRLSLFIRSGNINILIQKEF